MGLTRAQQRLDTIYVCPDGSTFVTPDGEGRFWYDRTSPADYGYADEIDLTGMTDEEAAIAVAKFQHGADLPLVYLDEMPEDY